MEKSVVCEESYISSLDGGKVLRSIELKKFRVLVEVLPGHTVVSVMEVRENGETADLRPSTTLYPGDVGSFDHVFEFFQKQ